MNPDAVLRGSKIWTGEWKEQRAAAYNMSTDDLEEHYRQRSLLKRSVFPEDRLITPDDVRGDHATLESAVLAGGWPELNDVRGQVLFFLDNRSYVRDLYRDGTPNLEGRVMFTTSEPGQPDAAVLQLQSPVTQEAQIAEAVRHLAEQHARAKIVIAVRQTGPPPPTMDAP